MKSPADQYRDVDAHDNLEAFMAGTDTAAEERIDTPRHCNRSALDAEADAHCGSLG